MLKSLKAVKTCEEKHTLTYFRFNSISCLVKLVKVFEQT